MDSGVRCRFGLSWSGGCLRTADRDLAEGCDDLSGVYWYRIKAGVSWKNTKYPEFDCGFKWHIRF